jgi:hypothetical protein
MNNDRVTIVEVLIGVRDTLMAQGHSCPYVEVILLLALTSGQPINSEPDTTPDAQTNPAHQIS